MRLWLAAVGRLKGGPEAALVEDYARRLTWPLTVREVEVKEALSGDALKRREAALLRAALPEGAVLAALDERGDLPSSPAFAERMRGWQDNGVRDLAFVIGGADGLDPALRAEARYTLAFGPMTWPHKLVRVLLLEQVYRAQQIIAGHPYHRA
ncbi:MAG TPA: 23S rRNA (pseudouridine(1915)-N(3))-methyltransferase RlmH [Alphaproteobacteria bacterium]|nr:23S rRNA (pseudouridine(1915)-N(3))-methyltransferase RlmH [Alphaproteobacteria bacterium]